MHHITCTVSNTWTKSAEIRLKTPKSPACCISLNCNVLANQIASTSKFIQGFGRNTQWAAMNGTSENCIPNRIYYFSRKVAGRILITRFGAFRPVRSCGGLASRFWRACFAMPPGSSKWWSQQLCNSSVNAAIDERLRTRWTNYDECIPIWECNTAEVAAAGKLIGIIKSKFVQTDRQWWRRLRRWWLELREMTGRKDANIFSRHVLLSCNADRTW